MSHTTKIPAGVSRAAAVTALQDTEHFLKRNPHTAHYEAITPDEPPTLPEGLVGTAPTTSFKVTDRMATLPAGLLDSDVVSTYQFTSVADGVFVRIFAPLGVVLETVWHVATAASEGGVEGDVEAETEATGPASTAEEDGELELVEDLTIRCSRLLVPVVRRQCENGWEEMHGKIITQLTAAA